MSLTRSHVSALRSLVVVFALAVPVLLPAHAYAYQESEHAEAESHGGDAESHSESSVHGSDTSHTEADGHESDGHATGGGHEEGGSGLQIGPGFVVIDRLCLSAVCLEESSMGPLIEGLDSREAGIRSAIAEAEENQRKSQALLAEYEEKLRAAEQTVAEMVAEAKRDAERTGQDIIAEARSEVDALRQRATEDIAQAKNTALSEVFTSVNTQVAAATERVLGRALSDDDQDRLIQEALSEIAG